MSVGTIKRILLMANVLAVVALSGTAYGFWRHRSALTETRKPVNFAPPPKGVVTQVARIDAIAMQLGLFPKPVEPAAVETAKDEEEIETVLQKLGSIKSAIVIYPPYTSREVPSITFEFRDLPAGQRIRTIGLGQGLKSRPHHDPGMGNHFPQPAAWKFVGCEPVPGKDGWTYFLFDRDCDDSTTDDIQKAQWRGDIQVKAPASATAGGTAATPARPKGMYVGSGKPEPKPEPKGSDPGPRPEVKAVDAPRPPPDASTELYGPLFEEENGTFAPTSEGAVYLRDNYQKILKDTRTATYRDPQTKRPRGLHVVGIKKKSIANQFGIRKDDVILSINDRPVTKQAQAVNVVKDELKKMEKRNRHVLQVKILRNGRTIVKQYDTRDPDNRRRARDVFRRRG